MVLTQTRIDALYDQRLHPRGSAQATDPAVQEEDIADAIHEDEMVLGRAPHIWEILGR